MITAAGAKTENSLPPVKGSEPAAEKITPNHKIACGAKHEQAQQQQAKHDAQFQLRVAHIYDTYD